jgi:TP901 family phage tail tape measure protein
MAASTGAIRAGAAYVEIFANDSKFQQSMTKMRTTMSTVGQQMRRAGTGMFLGGAAIGAPLMLAVRGAANFENALFDAKASAGLTAAQVDQIRVKSLELSKAGMGGPAAIAQAFTALVKAGMPLEQAMGGAAEAVIQFASNAGIDVTQAAETASDAMNVFGVSSTQATDILKAAADSSSTSVEAMVMAFSQSSAVAGMANQSMQTLAASLAIMANNGVKGSDAGTSIKTMLLRLSAPTDEAAAKLREVGLSADSFRGADGKMLPLANMLDTLGAALSGLSGGQRDQALLKIFGSDAIRAGTIMLKTGSAGLASMSQAMAQSGTNADAYKTKMSGITGAMQTVSAATERLQIAVATALGPAFQSASQAVAGFMDFMGKLATDFPGLITTAASLSVGLLGIGSAAIAIGVSLQGLATIIGVTQKAFGLLSSLSVLLSPVGLVAAGVAASIALIAVAARELSPDFKAATDAMLGLTQAGADTSAADSTEAVRESAVQAAAASNEAKILEEQQKVATEKANREKEAAMERGKTIAGQVATPEEKLREQVDELKRLRELGAIDSETFTRAIGQAKKSAVDDLMRQQKEVEDKQASFSSAGTFGSAGAIGIGPELAKLEDPTRRIAENTAATVDAITNSALGGGSLPQLAEAVATAPPPTGTPPAELIPGEFQAQLDEIALAVATGGDIFGAPERGSAAFRASMGAPPSPTSQSIAAETAAPRAVDVQQAADTGTQAATSLATLTTAVNSLSSRLVAAVGQTTSAVEATMDVLKTIAQNTADLGGSFV